MIRKTIIAALLAGSAIAATPAFAQEQLPEAQQEPTEPDASDTIADAAIASAAPVTTPSQIELLEAQVEALQKRSRHQAQIRPRHRGRRPLYEDKEAGWSFKPRGASSTTPVGQQSR